MSLEKALELACRDMVDILHCHYCPFEDKCNRSDTKCIELHKEYYINKAEENEV